MTISGASPTLRIHEIYDSIQGESTLAGMPCTFIRLAGCPLRCNYCDTPQAIPTDSGREMTLDQVVETAAGYGHPLILVTGGEPLAQRATIPLLARLQAIAEAVQLETSGAYDIGDVPDGISVILDIKTPSSGEDGRNHWPNLDKLKAGSEIKFVISDRSDYEWSRDIIQRRHLERLGIPLLASPAWNSLPPAELVRWILQDRLPMRVQLQLHKYIWGAEARGV